MPANKLVPLLIGLGPLAVWLLAYAAVLVATRARPVHPAAATPELGPEPPAVANMLLHQNDVTEDGAEATLLDLAARRVIELRGADADPAHTTVHVRDPNPAGLTRYERRVLDRVVSRGVDGVAPLLALPFSDPEEADRWLGELRGEVIHDARVRGLAANRLSGTMGLLFIFAAFGMPVAFAFGGAFWDQRADAPGPSPWTAPRFIGGLCAGVPVFLVLFYLTLRLQTLRLSRLGRERAAHWLGVRDWLSRYPSFADLPPAAAAVWDRYLAYGAALGVTDVASRTIHLGLGGRRTPWSSYGGRWRRVRVRPVRFGWARALLPPPGRVELHGQVLWATGDRIAIDDGTADRTRAWIVPPELVAGVYGGDDVTVTVHPWRRRVVALTVTARGADWRASSAPATPATVFRAIAPSAAGLRPRPLLDALPVEELSRLVGIPLRAIVTERRTDYVSTMDGRPVLRLELLDQIANREIWRARPAGWVLAGVGDEAYFGERWAVARLGDEFVLANSWPPAEPGLPARVVGTVLSRLAV